jgi:hypothetical protein
MLALQAANMPDGLNAARQTKYLRLALQTAPMNPNVVDEHAALNDMLHALQTVMMVPSGLTDKEMRARLQTALRRLGMRLNDLDYTASLDSLRDRLPDELRNAEINLSDHDFKVALKRLPMALRQVGMDPGDLGSTKPRNRLRAALAQANMVVTDPDFTPSRQGLLDGLDAAGLAPSADLKVTADDLKALALTIARNREIAGLHYPSDSRAGRMLADIVMHELTAEPTFRTAVTAAAKDWAP